MRTLAVALVVLLSTTNAWSVDLSFEVSAPIDLDDPGDLLAGYVVHVNGAKTFSDLRIVGDVHQVNVQYGGPPVPTTWRNDLRLWGGEAAAPYDTHFLFDSTDVVAITISYLEGNDGSNPSGIPLPINGINTIGMGVFDMTGLDFSVPGHLDPDGYDLLYVVLPKGQRAELVGRAVVGGEIVSFSKLIVIPEPATVAMFLAGVVCLFRFRLRRQPPVNRSVGV